MCVSGEEHSGEREHFGAKSLSLFLMFKKQQRGQGGYSGVLRGRKRRQFGQGWAQVSQALVGNCAKFDFVLEGWKAIGSLSRSNMV